MFMEFSKIKLGIINIYHGLYKVNPLESNRYGEGNFVLLCKNEKSIFLKKHASGKK